jgi:hypothetical protein
MNMRSLLAMLLSAMALSHATAGLVSSGSDESTAPPPNEATANDKAVLRRLIAELEKSSRSFRYLRYIGFTQSDTEFERLITLNKEILRSTHIVRYDQHGNRQIPGWPGVSLTPEYKHQHESD